MSAMARVSGAVIWLAAACAGLSCGSPAPSSGRPVTRQVIGAAGGQASAASGRFKIQIPPGALMSDVAITIRQVDPAVAGAIGPVFEVGPTGTLFQKQVTLSFTFTNAQLGGIGSRDLHVATLSGGQWVPVTSTVDLTASLVTGQITHLSPWTLIVYTAVVPPEPDASTGGDDGGGAGDDGGLPDGGTGGQAGGASGAGGGTGTAGADGGAPDVATGIGGAGGNADAGGAGTGGAGGQDGGAGDSGQGGVGGAAGATGQGGGGAGGQTVDADKPTDDAGTGADPDTDAT
jgi:hypothetical protein